MFASFFAAAVSLSGQTGLLTVPDASALPEGRAAFGYAVYDPRPAITGAETWHFGIGLLPGLELSGRVVESDQIRDLSFNPKLRLWQAENGASVAIGVQDLGGEARFLRTRYAVASVPVGPVSLTLGHGWGPDLLQGTLAGLEWKPVHWLGVLGEYDGDRWAPAARVQAGPLTSTVGYRDGEWVAGASLQVTLGRTRTTAPTVSALAGRKDRNFSALKRSLEAEGFESVRTGHRPDGTLAVQLENRVYNHSARDGIEAALRTVRAHEPRSPVELTVTAYGVPHYTSGSPGASPPDPRIPGPVTWHNKPAPLASTELVLEPVLRTLVATDFGVLDYGLSVRGRFTAPLGHGLVTNVALTSPAVHSDDVDAGRVYSAFEPKAGLDLATLQYFHKLHPQWGWLWTAGHTTVLRSTFKVAGFEQMWTTADVRHQLRARVLEMRGDDRAAHVAIAGYAYYDPVHDWSAGVSGGRYFRNEGGIRLDFARWFGDVRVGLFVRGAGREEQLGGLEFSLPLTPRKDMAPTGWLQVKGPRQWRHGLGTTLNASDGTNAIRPLLVYEPELDLDLRRDFYDSGRLGAY